MRLWYNVENTILRINIHFSAGIAICAVADIHTHTHTRFLAHKERAREMREHARRTSLTKVWKMQRCSHMELITAAKACRMQENSSHEHGLTIAKCTTYACVCVCARDCYAHDGCPRPDMDVQHLQLHLRIFRIAPRTNVSADIWRSNAPFHANVSMLRQSKKHQKRRNTHPQQRRPNANTIEE